MDKLLNKVRIVDQDSRNGEFEQDIVSSPN